MVSQPQALSRPQALWTTAVCVVALTVGCGPSVQRATILPTAPPVTAPAKGGGPRPIDLRPAARRYVIDASRSRFELIGSDIVRGEHKGTFGSWRGEVTVNDHPTIHVEVDTDSIDIDTPGATSVLKRYFLETHRYPLAKLDGTLSRTDGPPDEHVVEGTTEVHGVRRGIRFVGTLRAEGDGYRFKTKFVISRKEFHVRYGPLEPFVRDDVRIVVDVYAAPVPDGPPPAPSPRQPPEPPKPAETAPPPVPSTWYTPPR